MAKMKTLSRPQARTMELLRKGTLSRYNDTSSWTPGSEYPRDRFACTQTIRSLERRQLLTIDRGEVTLREVMDGSRLPDQRAALSDRAKEYLFLTKPGDNRPAWTAEDCWSFAAAHIEIVDESRRKDAIYRERERQQIVEAAGMGYNHGLLRAIAVFGRNGEYPPSPAHQLEPWDNPWGEAWRRGYAIGFALESCYLMAWTSGDADMDLPVEPDWSKR